MDELMGEFTVDSTHAELPSLPPKLADNVISLSGLVGNLGDMAWTSVGRAQFKFILPLPMAADVAVLRDAVSVSAWDAWHIRELPVLHYPIIMAIYPWPLFGVILMENLHALL